MKAVRAAEGGVSVVDLDEPPGTGVLLDMKAASICSSDFGYIAFGSRMILGHELAGVLPDGSAAVVEALYGCGTCALCRRGDYHLCPTHTQRALGITADGGMSEQFRAPPERVIPLPAGLQVRDASMVEPASVAWHALRLGRTSRETRVAIVGAGAIGLLAVAAARRHGAPDVAVEARHPNQRAAAERLGARVGTDGLYDVVVEAAGTVDSLARAVELAAPGGTVVVPGVHMGPVEIPWHTAFLREVRIVPSLGYCTHDGIREMDEAAAMLAENPEIAATLITHRFPIEDGAEAFRIASDREAGAIRVVIEPA